MYKDVIDIAIIGAGAAGLASAVTSSKAAISKNKNLTIAIFEKDNQIGKSILKTGNGRCNFSNYYAYKNNGKEYNNPKICKSVFDSCKNKVNNINVFDFEEDCELKVPTYNMFEYLGLACTIDDEGRMYPYTGKAISVVDVFEYALNDLKVKQFLNHEMTKINPDQEKSFYNLYFSNGKTYRAKKIIITTGGIDNKFGLLRNSLTKINKALGPIKTNIEYLKSLDGTRAHVGCTLKNLEDNITNQDKKSNNKTLNYYTVHQETGEILFRKYGVSGICVFNVSRFLDEKKSQVLEIDFAPDDSFEELYETLVKRYNLYNFDNHISAERLLSGMLLKNIVNSICKYAKLDTNNIIFEDLYNLAFAIKYFVLKIKGIWDKNMCQITQGGINCNEINTNSMELNNSKNIYLAGEMLDIDGPCGGFNLHWAWTSGILAGISAI